MKATLVIVALIVILVTNLGKTGCDCTNSADSTGGSSHDTIHRSSAKALLLTDSTGGSSHDTIPKH